MSVAQHTYDELIQENAALRARLELAERQLADRADRKPAAEQIHATEQQLGQILDKLVASVLLLDANGRHLYINQRAAASYGLTPAEVIGKSLSDLLPPDVAQAYIERNRRFIAARDFAEYEETFTVATGQRTFFICDQVLSSDRGDTLLSSAVDITERVQAQADLQVALTKYRTLFDTFPLGITVSDATGQIVESNAMAERLLGIKHEQHTQRQIDGVEWRIVRPDGSLMPAEEFASVRALSEQRLVENVEMGIITLAGVTTWINVTAAPLPLECYGVVITYSDITARKQAELALQRSEQAFRTLYQSMRDAFVGVDMEGKIREYNHSYRDLIGYSDEEIPHLTYKDITPEQWHTMEDQIVAKQIMAHGYSDVYEKEYRRKDGTIVPIELSTMLTRDEQGQPTGMWAIIRDISARKQAEQALHVAMEELTRSNEDLEQFAYVASHDLQEPLRGVIGMVQLLQQRYQGQLDARADQYIRLAVESATRMQALINDLLMFSRVQRHGQPFVTVAVEKALGDALANLQVAITECSAEITHDALPTILADPTQIAQLFQNLIGNAIKFRDEVPPRIHIGASRRADAWCFAVRDNGIGIAPDYFERIFVIFQRLHPRQAYPGTGIGLALCKKIVERHGGQIWVESHLGHGATFFFTIPDRN
jgi:PAS domain S-box-containing protein